MRAKAHILGATFTAALILALTNVASCGDGGTPETEGPKTGFLGGGQGGPVSHDSTLSGSGTPASPLTVSGTGGATITTSSPLTGTGSSGSAITLPTTATPTIAGLTDTGSASFAGSAAITGSASFASYLNDTDQSTPSTPSSGLDFYSKNIAGRSMLATLNSEDGKELPLQTSMAAAFVSLWSASPNGTTFNVSGNGAGIIVSAGTLTAKLMSGGGYYQQTARIQGLSTSSASSVAAVRTASLYPLVYVGGGSGQASAPTGFYYDFVFAISDASLVSTANMFIGLLNTSYATDTAPDTRTNLIGVCIDDGDTELKLCAAGASAQTRSTLNGDTGALFPANTTATDVYELTLYAPPGVYQVTYRLKRLNNGNTSTGVISAAANLPGSNSLSWQIIRSNGGTASAVGIDINRVYLEAFQ